jgi:hypothetical protein
MCGTGAVVDMWHWDCAGLVALELVDVWHWGFGGHVTLGLWWTCGTGVVVDLWHWNWWMCGTGAVVDVWRWGWFFSLYFTVTSAMLRISRTSVTDAV